MTLKRFLLMRILLTVVSCLLFLLMPHIPQTNSYSSNQILMSPRQQINNQNRCHGTVEVINPLCTLHAIHNHQNRLQTRLKLIKACHKVSLCLHNLSFPGNHHLQHMAVTVNHRLISPEGTLRSQHGTGRFPSHPSYPQATRPHIAGRPSFIPIHQPASRYLHHRPRTTNYNPRYHTVHTGAATAQQFVRIDGRVRQMSVSQRYPSPSTQQYVTVASPVYSNQSIGSYVSSGSPTVVVTTDDLQKQFSETREVNTDNQVPAINYNHTHLYNNYAHRLKIR